MLADYLKSGTRTLHRRAETSGIVADLLSGRASIADYALYLRNLLPVYEVLDAELLRRRNQDGWQTITLPQMHRAPAIASDLGRICIDHSLAELPVLARATQYSEIIEQTRTDASGRLFAAHVYTRLLGDLNGGRILAGRLGSLLGLTPQALRFYHFDVTEDISQFTLRYRAAIDALDPSGEARDAILEETRRAFRLNIALSVDIQNHRMADPGVVTQG